MVEYAVYFGKLWQTSHSKIVFITKDTLWRFYFAEQPTTFHDFCGTGAADATQTSFLHIDKEIPMQSASLEAQKFKTIIFLSGQ